MNIGIFICIKTFLQACLKKLFKSLFDLVPIIKNNESTINQINSTQDKVIKKGTIDPESQVSSIF